MAGKNTSTAKAGSARQMDGQIRMALDQDTKFTSRKDILDHEHEVRSDMRGQTTSLDVVNTDPPSDGLPLCGGNSGRTDVREAKKHLGGRASLDGVSRQPPWRQEH
jgi:hypothetical protein